MKLRITTTDDAGIASKFNLEQTKEDYTLPRNWLQLQLQALSCDQANVEFQVQIERLDK